MPQPGDLLSIKLGNWVHDAGELEAGLVSGFDPGLRESSCLGDASRGRQLSIELAWHRDLQKEDRPFAVQQCIPERLMGHQEVINTTS